MAAKKKIINIRAYFDGDASYHLQAAKGKFTGVVPPLGYQKDPEEKGYLLIDDETAPIVRKIFQWAVDVVNGAMQKENVKNEFVSTIKSVVQ